MQPVNIHAMNVKVENTVRGLLNLMATALQILLRMLKRFPLFVTSRSRVASKYAKHFFGFGVFLQYSRVGQGGGGGVVEYQYTRNKAPNIPQNKPKSGEIPKFRKP